MLCVFVDMENDFNVLKGSFIEQKYSNLSVNLEQNSK